MTRTHYIRRGNVITLPERHRPRLDLVQHDYVHDTDRLMRTGLGRHPPSYNRDWLCVAALWALYVIGCYFWR